jgi:tripartite-type tricarboxylate transporter receptor subunit TctC
MVRGDSRTRDEVPMLVDLPNHGTAALSRRHLIAASAAALAGGLSSVCHANTIDRPARLMVGFPAGSAPDLVARLLAEHMKNYAPLILVENRPGAGGRLPLEALKGGDRDGSLMVLTPGYQITLFPHIYAKPGYDALRDFAPVSTVCAVQYLLVVGPLVPDEVKRVADFVAWCRANPKLADYGSPGEGTLPHFMGASFARAAGMNMTHVPYRGAPPIVQDMLAGQIASTISVVSNVLANVQSGRLRGLAIMSPKRATFLPDIPTIRESGYPAAEGVEFFELFVRANTPDKLVSALNSAVGATLRTDAFVEGLAKQAFEPAGCTPSELARLVKSDTDRWADIVKQTGFTPLD